MLASFCMYAPNAALHKMHASVFATLRQFAVRTLFRNPSTPSAFHLVLLGFWRANWLVRELPCELVFRIPPLPAPFGPVLLGFSRELSFIGIFFGILAGHFAASAC